MIIIYRIKRYVNLFISLLLFLLLHTINETFQSYIRISINPLFLVNLFSQPHYRICHASMKYLKSGRWNPFFFFFFFECCFHILFLVAIMLSRIFCYNNDIVHITVYLFLVRESDIHITNVTGGIEYFL